MASLKCIIPDCKNPVKEEMKRMSDEHIQSVTWSKEGQFRVESAVSDLHAADARYRQECKTNFLHSSYLDRLAKTPENDIDIALPCVIKFMKANGKERRNNVEVLKISSENRG